MTPAPEEPESEPRSRFELGGEPETPRSRFELGGDPPVTASSTPVATPTEPLRPAWSGPVTPSAPTAQAPAPLPIPPAVLGIISFVGAAALVWLLGPDDWGNFGEIARSALAIGICFAIGAALMWVVALLVNRPFHQLAAFAVVVALGVGAIVTATGVLGSGNKSAADFLVELPSGYEYQEMEEGMQESLDAAMSQVPGFNETVKEVEFRLVTASGSPAPAAAVMVFTFNDEDALEGGTATDFMVQAMQAGSGVPSRRESIEGVDVIVLEGPGQSGMAWVQDGALIAVAGQDRTHVEPLTQALIRGNS